MHRIAATAALIFCVLGPGWLQAGLYNTAEPPKGPAAAKVDIKAVPFSDFRDQLAELFTLGVPQPESPARARTLEEIKRLESRLRSGSATVDDQMNLGAYLIKVGRSAEAVDVLSRASALDRRNALLLATLGTAHQLEGRWGRAIDYLQQAMDVWPRELPGLTPQQLAWFRRAEEYQMKLARLRAREALGSSASSSKPAESLDDLFGVRFVGAGGQYEAGQMAVEQKKKLPPDAIAIVQQLLTWMPGDARLYWLLGELLNAQGDVGSAATVFDESAWTRRYDAPALREHRQVVREAKAKADALLGTIESSPEEAQPGWRLDRRLIWIGAMVGGLVLGLLAYLQFREIRNRNQESGIRNQKS